MGGISLSLSVCLCLSVSSAQTKRLGTGARGQGPEVPACGPQHSPGSRCEFFFSAELLEELYRISMKRGYCRSQLSSCWEFEIGCFYRIPAIFRCGSILPLLVPERGQTSTSHSKNPGGKPPIFGPKQLLVKDPVREFFPTRCEPFCSLYECSHVFLVASLGQMAKSNVGRLEHEHSHRSKTVCNTN